MGQEITKAQGNIEHIATQIKSGRIKNIIVLCGAGISVNCGIPDFRTPGTGLYDNLQKFDLPTPESIFTLSYFREHPQAFYTLAKDLYPGKYKPSKTHEFIKFLADRKLLLRCYTQNIDGLEILAGVPRELVVQAHGNFDTVYCIDCFKEQDPNVFKESCLKGEILRCCVCDGLTKPSIVFFEEALPVRFRQHVSVDFPKCDCVLIMGSSLTVAPFSSLVNAAPEGAPRILMNREQTANCDVFMQGDCDASTAKLRALII